MRPFILVFLISIGMASFCVHGQNPQVGPALPFVTNIALDAPAIPTQATGDGGVFWLLWDDQISLADAARYHREVKQITSPSGMDDVSQLSIDFDPQYQTLTLHHLNMIREGKTIHALDRIRPTLMQREDQWDRRLLDGRTTALYVLQDVRLGDRIDLAYTIRGNNPVFQGKMSGWQLLALSWPVARRHVRIVSPDERPVTINRLGGAAPYQSISVPGQSEFIWDLRQVAPIAFETNAPAWHPQFPRIEWSEFGSWHEVVKWARDIYRQPDDLSAELLKRIEHLRTLETEDRIREALRFVQDSVRYLGMEMGASSHAPRHPDSVLQRRFGDCKEKTLLFCTMMNRSGVEATPVLVNTEAGPTLILMNPAPTAFDHVIARVKWKGRHMYVDPTMTGQRGQPSTTDDPPYQTGLPVDENTYGPVDFSPSGHSSARIDYDVSIPDWKKEARMKITAVYSGFDADRVRRDWISTPYSDLEKSYRQFNSRMFDGLRNLDSTRFSEDPVSGQVTTEETYAIDSLCTPSPGLGRRECSFAPIELLDLLRAPDADPRTSPYAIPWPKKVSATMRIHLPEDMGLLNASGRLALPEAIITWDEKGKGEEHSLTYTYESLSDHVTSDRLKAYSEALNEVGREYGVTYFLLDDAQAGIFGAHPNFFWIFLLGGSLVAAVWCYKRTLRLHPLRQHQVATQMGEDGTPQRWIDTVPRQLGGWLYLVAFGLIGGVLIRTWNLKDFLPYLNRDTWEQLTSTTGRAFHAGWEPLLIFEAVLNIAGMGALVACTVLFFQRRRNFPKAYVVVIAALTSVDLLDSLLIYLAGMAELLELTQKEVQTDLRHALFSLFWILYMIQSTRVKETFLLPAPAMERTD